jgi:thiamine biosynthesis lipoprotein
MNTALDVTPSTTGAWELTFPAMGTEVHLLAAGAEAPGVLDEVRDLVASWEARWSRFRPDSELSRLNAAAGRPVVLAADTFALVEAAVEAWRLTGGRFDPTVLAALVAAGYDRSFELIASDSPGGRVASPGVPGCAGIALQRDTGTVLLPAGVGLDLGGIAKGHSADRAVAAILARGAAGAVANFGGDVSVAGVGPDTDAWTIAVDDPHNPGRDLAVLTLAAGAVATSTRTRRRWTRGGRRLHHLIDPATGAPADRGIDAAVVIAGQALWAEVLAKAALVAGPDDGAALLDRFGATGLLILDSGEAVPLPRLEEYLR